LAFLKKLLHENINKRRKGEEEAMADAFGNLGVWEP
jgi:hypothetical protein